MQPNTLQKTENNSCIKAYTQYVIIRHGNSAMYKSDNQQVSLKGLLLMIVYY